MAPSPHDPRSDPPRVHGVPAGGRRALGHTQLEPGGNLPEHFHPTLTETWVTPPGRLEEFLTESARSAQEGLYNARNLPTGLRGAAWVSEFALRFRDETVMTSPPPALQKLALPLTARLTRRWR